MKEVALLGCGIVGGGIPLILRDNSDIIEKTVGDKVELKYILELRDCSKEFYADKVITDFSIIENDPEVEVVAECIGGTKVAYEFVKRSLLAGKNVVTSNKQLIAEKGSELLEIAKEKDLFLLCEASVGGGIPIIRPLANCLAANRIEEITGIVNGTTNFILSQMKEEGQDFATALRKAQELGYAEADPTADIEGLDAMRKIAILADIAFGSYIPPEKVKTRGITSVSDKDVALAEKLGYSIKLLAHAKRMEGDTFALEVAPHLVGGVSMFNSVRGVMNAVAIRGNAVGECLFYGPGAGRMPTASAVVGDILDIFRRENSRKYITWSKERPECLVPAEKMVSRWFVRYNGAQPEGMEATVTLEDGTKGSITEPLTEDAMKALFSSVAVENSYRILD